MRAARVHDKGDIRVEDIDEPKAGPGKCIVEVEWCGICGSDLHEFMKGPTRLGEPPHILTGETVPITMGHELCGRVINPSPESGLKHGDAVMVDPRILCRTCKYCTSGRSYGCENQGYLGSHAGGGFAERCSVEERMLHKLPENCPLEYAAVIEPLAVVQHAISMTRLTDWKEKNVLVLGGGPIGLAMIIALKAHGAERTIVSEPAAARRRQVLELTDHAIDPITNDVVVRCEELTKSHGIDVIFDCAGVPAGLETGVQALKLEGMYMNIAVWAKSLVIPVEKFMWKHITMKSSFRFSDEAFQETMVMMGDGRFIGYEKLVTGRIGLEDIVEQGFKELIDHKEEHIKIMVSTKIQEYGFPPV